MWLDTNRKSLHLQKVLICLCLEWFRPTGDMIGFRLRRFSVALAKSSRSTLLVGISEQAELVPVDLAVEDWAVAVAWVVVAAWVAVAAEFSNRVTLYEQIVAAED